MRKIAIFCVLTLVTCMVGWSQSTEDKKKGLTKIGGNSMDGFSIVVNESTLR